MEIKNTRKLFHEDYPIEITGMSEAEVNAAVIAFKKNKGLNEQPEKPQAKIIDEKKPAKAKKAKRVRKPK